MRTIILTCIVLLAVVLIALKLMAPGPLTMRDDGSPDSPIVVADSSSTTTTGTQASATPAKTYTAHVGHSSFILDAASGPVRGVALVHDVIPGFLGVFNTERRVTSFEVNSTPPDKIDLTPYQSWSLKITSVSGTKCSSNPMLPAPCVFTISSNDNKTVTIDPNNVPLSPSYNAGWNLLDPGNIASATLQATDSSGNSQPLYPSASYTPPGPNTWQIELHYCRRRSCN